MAKIRIAVLFGGKSGEHEVSCVSASHVIKAINTEKYEIKKIGITKEGEWLLYRGPIEGMTDGSWIEYARKDLKENPEDCSFELLGSGNRSIKSIVDFVLPILHGPNGEDGTVQGLLELINIPYGGCGVLGCASTMDKLLAKEVFANAGLKQTPYVGLVSSQIGPEIEKKINAELKYPLFVKPANMGSSVGISKVSEPGKLLEALKTAAEYDSRIVVEQGVNCRELEVAVMGNDEVITGEVGEIIPGAEFYDYNAKYACSESKTLIPADITPEQKTEIQNQAKKAYTALACSGFSRVDFMMDKDSGDILINEINAIPGFTGISMFPMLMQAAGMTYPEIVERIIQLGYERYHAENNRQHTGRR